MKPQFLEGILIPFSEYPLTRRFKDTRISKTIILISILMLSGLVTFNVITQGSVAQTESVLYPHWHPKNDTLSCQPAAMGIGSTCFTNRAPENIDNRVPTDEDKEDYRGAFLWTLQSVVKGIGGQDTARTAFQYQESIIKCNITFVSLNFDFQIQTLTYSICVMCSTPSVEDVEDNFISLCTSYNQMDNILPKFTDKVQKEILQPQIYGLSRYYSLLSFGADTLPGTAFPPYSNSNLTLPRSDIPNRDILHLSSWMNGFNYTPAAEYSFPFNKSNLYMQPNPQGKLYLSPTDTQPTDFSEGFIKTLSLGQSGFQIAVVGIGGLRPIPRNVSLSDALTVAEPIPLFFNLTQSIIAIMMDMAGEDVDGRVLGVSYLCTVTATPWKTLFPMLAMIFGNCSGMFGAGLTALIFIARTYDDHMVAKKSAGKSSQPDEERIQEAQELNCLPRSAEDGDEDILPDNAKKTYAEEY